MSDELLPITEADVVPGAEFMNPFGNTVTVLAVADGCAMYRYPNQRDPYALTLADFIDWARKRAPKPKRHVVELRPPKQGERYVVGCDITTADWDYDYARPVIVEELS